MFVRKEDKLPKDPAFPADFEKLGYFVTPTGKILNSDKPSEFFRFRITTSERHNEAQREALHEAALVEVHKQLEESGVQRIFLPKLSTIKPSAPDTFLPILMTSPQQLKTKRRIIVIVNDSREDLGVLAWRLLTRDGGISGGSMIDLVKGIHVRAAKEADEKNIPRDEAMPGIIILNPGQLLFSHKLRRAMSYTSWMSRRRQSAVHPPPNIHETYNRIPQNSTVEEHIRFVFKNVLGNSDVAAPEAELYLIGIADGGDTIMRYLEQHLEDHRIAALALTAPVPTIPTTARISLKSQNAALISLLAERSRAWCISHLGLNTPLANATPSSEIIQAASDYSVSQGYDESMREIALFPMVSGGEEKHTECILPAAWPAILDWFGEVSAKGGSATYSNPQLDVSEDMQLRTLNALPTAPQDWSVD